METNKKIARRKPPATGLTACLYRSTDGMYCSHKIKKNVQLRTKHPPFTGSIKCRSRDCSPTALHILINVAALLSSIVKVVFNVLFAGAKIVRNSKYNYLDLNIPMFNK